MIYLKSFTFPSEDSELDFLRDEVRTCYTSYYPFRILSKHNLQRIEFEPITILYGGNGSGKSTALNVIAEKSMVKRDSVFNKTSFYPQYADMCQMSLFDEPPANSRIITSDDVFDYMLNIRTLNEGIDGKREELFEEYLTAKYSDFKFNSLEDYDELKRVNKARSKTQSKFVKSELMKNVLEFSNGETAYKYFLQKIGEDGLYILDEPENSLAPKLQLELKKFIEDSARFFGCQFIISTHSPFLLSMKGAKIYNLDENPVAVKKWTELENVKLYYDFFKENASAFQNE